MQTKPVKLVPRFNEEFAGYLNEFLKNPSQETWNKLRFSDMRCFDMCCDECSIFIPNAMDICDCVCGHRAPIPTLIIMALQLKAMIDGKEGMGNGK